MTRDELPGAVQAIRTDLEGWLAREEHRELRTWLFAGDEVVTVPAGQRTRAASSRRAVAEAAGASDVPPGSTV